MVNRSHAETEVIPRIRDADTGLSWAGGELLGVWQAQLHEAIGNTDRAIRRWRDRKLTVIQLTAKLDPYARRSWMGQDGELADALSDYGFWQREVTRLSAQIQAAIALNTHISRSRST